MMSEVSLVAGEAAAGLQKRLDEEISAFNAAATMTAVCCLSRSAGIVVTCARDSTGGRGAGAATSTCSGCATTSAVAAWEPSSSPQPKLRSVAAAATG